MGYGAADTEEDVNVTNNPIVEVNLQATAQDNFYFVNGSEEQYIGPYHIHQNGDIMIGVGVTEPIPSIEIFIEPIPTPYLSGYNGIDEFNSPSLPPDGIVYNTAMNAIAIEDAPPPNLNALVALYPNINFPSDSFQPGVTTEIWGGVGAWVITAFVNNIFSWAPNLTENLMIGTLSPEEQWTWDGYDWKLSMGIISSEGQWEWNGTDWNIKLGLLSPEGQWEWDGDGWIFKAGSILHTINSDEIIIQKATYESIQQTRERVSDLFYKLWFESNTLSDDAILSMQTTIRDGIKQSGRTEDEPLVFYKKDRNTLENRKDLQGDAFDDICRYIFINNIIDLEGKFSIIPVDLPTEGTPPQEVTQYKIKFTDGTTSYEVNVARKVGDTFTDILNLSQLTKTKTGFKIDAEKAREILDTNIFELLPNQPNRQEQINNFFGEFDNLVGPTPVFTDANGDGAAEQPENYEVDEQSRISFKNKINASITRLDSQANEDNGDKTLESMRNKLNNYLGDVDNVIENLDDQRPEYENISSGFLKIRKPNQAIIIRGQSNNLLEFQKLNANGTPSYLSDGFTITMWVRFVDKQSSGTLFNFGNPNEIDGSGFRLETYVTIDGAGNSHRILRLVVKDTLVRDNHYGYRLSNGNPAMNRLTGIDLVDRTNYNPVFRYPTRAHNIYPKIPTDDLNEWYFICATFNPNVVEVNLSEDNPLRSDTSYWLNHKIYYNTLEKTQEDLPFISVGNRDEIVANSFEGAKCKVEIISRTDLLKARGYKVDDISVTAPPIDDINDEEDSNIEPNPTLAPNGFNPMTNPMTGTLSPQGQWRWDGQGKTWVAVEIEEEEDPFFNDGDTSESDADNEDNKNVETDKSLTDVETDDFDDGVGGY